MSLDERLDRADKIVTAGGMSDLAEMELKEARRQLAAEIKLASSMAEFGGGHAELGNVLTGLLDIGPPPSLDDELMRLAGKATRLADIERRNR